MNKEKREHTAPLGSAKSARLEFVRGAANVTLHVGSGMEDLYHARFDGPVPDVGAEGGAVTVKYTWALHPFDWRRRGVDIALNAQVPWRITVRGGVSRLDADLGGLRLDSFEVEGGASRVELTLPDPFGAVPIRIDGGASNVTVRRPEGVAARVDVGGGASKLALDGQRLGAIGGETRLESPGYAGATDRYEIFITGGANNVVVGTRLTSDGPRKRTPIEDYAQKTLEAWGMSTINGKVFDPDRIDARPLLGSTEIWEISGDPAHPIHLHLVQFRVLSRDGGPPGPYDAGWKDTVYLEGGTVRVVARFDGYRGKYVFHCHNLEHEDMMMMANFEVV